MKTKLVDRKAYKKAYMKVYNQRPEVKAYMKRKRDEALRISRRFY